MSTIVLPDWLLWIAAFALACHVCLSILRLWLVREVKRWCADRGLTNAELRRVLDLCERGKS